jgi:hypothetical protein
MYLRWAAPALFSFMILCSCAVVHTRDELPPTHSQIAGNYDVLASCFARRSRNKAERTRSGAAAILERFTNPNEIRVTGRGGQGILMWEVDFQPSGEARTDLEARLDTQYLTGNEAMWSGLIEDLRSCGADVPIDLPQPATPCGFRSLRPCGADVSDARHELISRWRTT